MEEKTAAIGAEPVEDTGDEKEILNRIMELALSTGNIKQLGEDGVKAILKLIKNIDADDVGAWNRTHSSTVPNDFNDRFRESIGAQTGKAFMGVMRTNMNGASGLRMYSAALALGGIDGNLFLSVHHTDEEAYLGGGIGEKINWLKKLAFLDSNVASATKAGKDGNGNVIADTYAKKSIYGDKHINFNDYFSAGNGSGPEEGGGYYACFAVGSYAKLGLWAEHGAFSLGNNTMCNAAGGSHSLGSYTECTGSSGACADGFHTKASNDSSCALGKYNKPMVGGGGGSNQIGDAFVIGNGTSDTARSNAMRVTFSGSIMGTKAFQSSGADYAEYIKPWADGNPEAEDRVGYFVTIKDGFLEKANGDDYIAGITSGNPSVVGNADEDYYWRYERDEFNRIVMEDLPETVQEKITIQVPVQEKYENGDLMYGENGEPVFTYVEKESLAFDEFGNAILTETGNIIKNARMKLAENYDPSLQESYIPREKRQEWDYVGMVGVLPVRDDGTCVSGCFCKCGQGGIATFAEERGFDTYMVLERVADNIVSVILK